MIMIAGAIGWGWSKLTNTTGTSETLSMVAFYVGASVWLGMLLLWAPYKKWKDAAPELVEAQAPKTQFFCFHRARDLIFNEN